MRVLRQVATMLAAAVTVAVPGFVTARNDARAETYSSDQADSALRAPAGLDGSDCKLPRAFPYTDSDGVTYNCIGSGSVGKWVRISGGGQASGSRSSVVSPTKSATSPGGLVGKTCSKSGLLRAVNGVNYTCAKTLRWVLAVKKSSAPGGLATTTSTTVARRPDPLADEYRAFSKALPRIVGDRPDDRQESAQVKLIYVVPKFATDRKRDTSGELSRYAFAANEWLASQNGGFGLRFDTFQGALDVGYLPLDLSKDEWYDIFLPSDGWRNGLSRMQEYLKRAGYPITVVRPNESQEILRQHKREKLYLLFYEAPRGTYSRTGAGFGLCWPTIDAINDGVALGGKALANDDGTSCGDLDIGRSNDAMSVRDMTQWLAKMNPLVDHVLQWMRWLPDCGYPRTPKDGERVKIPGVLDESKAWEIRGGFLRDLAEPNDPLSSAFAAGQWIDKYPKIDVRNDLYFHITSDKLASAGECNSDVSRHPLWDNLPLDRDSGRTMPRSSYDRPDDISGPQVKAVYVVRNGAADRMYDTSGDIERSVRQADAWLRAESGKGLRIDTFQGNVDVMYLPLPPGFENNSGDSCAGAPCPNERDFYTHLQSIGRVDPSKTYLFFYSGEVRGLFVCGGSRGGKAVLLNLTEDPTRCRDLNWTGKTTADFSWGLLALHEILHSLGAVCPSAPDYDGSSHSKAVGDIMAAGATGKVKLDPNRRNYWGNVPAGCTDVSQSPLFDG